ncbi:hypothetical protein CUMW_271860 [Citrus unshiu]|uniref:Uncharacterized protein n=1 Tax=Citrus unshiu TaxID=55188 RepID=A0A2H5QXS3_CITUN|nr:hypothetical protein CUMW_271860 [Citrus unshiu]
MTLTLLQEFSVKRRGPELIGPALAPKSHEVKQLSDIDDQQGLWFQVPLIFFYKNNPSPSMKGKDPVKVIKEALSRALVYYYPFAGRLREGSNGKLMVDCNGEGVLFTEADADFSLDQLGDDEIKPPCPYLDELLYDVPGSEGTLGCPLLLFQVTRLICGGFVLAFRVNHTMCDAFGFVQFLKAMEEMAWDNAKAPSLLPIWQRELLNARNPPQISCVHHEYDQIDPIKATLRTKNPNDLDHKSLFFGPKEILSLRNQLPPHLKNCTTFELLTACIWRCRTIALGLDPNEIVRVSFTFNIRGKRFNMQIPQGYYGNAFVFPAVCSRVDALCGSPLGYAVELVKEGKAKVSEEYIRSVADLMVTRGRPVPTTMGDLYFIVSDTTRTGFEEIDFGFGKQPVAIGVS